MSNTMTEQADALQLAWWANNLEELDREIARAAMLCDVKLLEPGVIERVLRNDASVCGIDNPTGFAKLRQLMMMHLAIRTKAVNAVGAVQTAQIESHVIERLKESFASVMGGSWPPV